MTTTLNVTKEWQDNRVSRSPVRNLLKVFASSPYQIAPERSPELAGLTDELNIRLQLDIAGEGFNFEAFDDKENVSRVSVNLITLEKLWALSYGYFALQQLQEKNLPGTNVSAPPDIAVLLSWAHNTPNTPTNEWPANMPRPDQPHSGEFINEATEVFLGVSSWIILHEIGHHIHGDTKVGYDHQPGGEFINHAMEDSADQWATRHVMQSWKSFDGVNPNVFVKRGFSIGLAILILAASRMLKLQSMESRTHPSTIRRLRSYFRELQKMYGHEFSKEIETIKFHIVRVLFAVLEVSRRIKGGPEIQIEHEDSDACLNYIETRYSNMVFVAPPGLDDTTANEPMGSE